MCSTFRQDCRDADKLSNPKWFAGFMLEDGTREEAISQARAHAANPKLAHKADFWTAVAAELEANC